VSGARSIWKRKGRREEIGSDDDEKDLHATLIARGDKKRLQLAAAAAWVCMIE
jgi:hypothetical protein